MALRRFDSLDGLRAISVLGVVWHHTAAKAFAGSPLATMGSEGVTLFFAISGFLITTLLLRERDRHGSIDLKAFYVRRTLRIFPIYYITLATYVALVWLMERNSEAGREFMANLPYFATYTSNWFVELKDRTIFYFAWSLAAEEQFYLVWPPLLVLLATRRRGLMFIALAAGLLVAHQLALTASGQWQLALTWSYRFPLAIVLGAGAALLLHDRAAFDRVAPVLGRPGAPLVMAIALLACLTLPSVPSVLTHAACMLLVVSTCIQRQHVLSTLLAWRPLAYIGAISYGIYLFHMLAAHAAKMVLTKLGMEAHWSVSFPAAVVASIIVAGISFRWIESRFLALKTRFER